ncbi:TetR/AcrR family transcriptional regulator [Georgenia sp. MJ170]|uniref:TetR/AcrR family transcriptional regulator n=1 Tax=Georgenia sunbinii TaxID=3117728 RepID=UPI002F266BF2
MTDPPRPLSPAGRRIVHAAEELFYNRGITAVGVDLIAEHSGVSKRTLYNQFGSKEHLVAAYLSARDDRWRTLVAATVAACDDPVEAVTAPFAALEEWIKTNTRGCAFINALAELPDPADPAHTIATDQKRWLLNLFERLATEAGATAPSQLATQLLLLHEGTLATQPLLENPLRASTELARTLARASVSDS